jgi:hypothetical protein
MYAYEPRAGVGRTSPGSPGFVTLRPAAVPEGTPTFLTDCRQTRMILCQISDPHIVARTLAYGRIDTPPHLALCAVLAWPRARCHGHRRSDGPCRCRGIRGPARNAGPRWHAQYLAVGNHDDRDLLRAAFPEHRHLAGEGGFVQYVVDEFTVRLVVLDTLIPGAPGGRLCEQRLQWLDRMLAASDRPTIVAQHHPPLADRDDIMDRWRSRIRRPRRPSSADIRMSNA